ncbi:MAG TPA: butyrate kinase [Bacteroidetes bacterium]|nr:butyrate kinase [Bacteroidota bacterium]
MKEHEVVIVLNPGSTSTKFGLYNRQGPVFVKTVRHTAEDLNRFGLVTEQLNFRYKMVFPVLKKEIKARDLVVVGVVGRGGIVRPVEGGTYLVNEAFLEDARSCRYGNHASNLGTLLADRFRREYGLQTCYTVDPVSVDNMWDKARVSGHPDIVRVCRGHPLNVKRTARIIAEEIGKKPEECRFVVAHLGGGFSVTAVENGMIRDVNDALLGMGPFSPNRAGALPLRGVMKMCYTMTEEEVTRILSRESGLLAYLGTDDLREVLKMLDDGDKKAGLVYEAFVYQIAKEIGATFAALHSEADGIIVTGGIVCSERFVHDLKAYVGRLAPFFSVPGEYEMEALAEGAFRVIDGEEVAKDY